MTDRYEYTLNNGLLASKTANTRQNCHRCGQLIYEKDKFGPVNSHIYHKSCFKCFACDTSLTLKSYKTSQANINDKEVYCNGHAPKSGGLSQMPPSKWNTNPAAATMHRTSSKENLLSETIIKSVDKQPASSSAMYRTPSKENIISETLVRSVDKPAQMNRASSRDNLISETIIRSVENPASSSAMYRTPSKENIISETLVRSVVNPAQMTRASSRDNLVSNTIIDGVTNSNSNFSATSTRVESEVSKMFAESKKWSSKENLIAMNTHANQSGNGRVATLTKKWNSRENLDATDSPHTMRKNSSSNLLVNNVSSRSGSRDDLSELRPSSEYLDSNAGGRKYSADVYSTRLERPSEADRRASADTRRYDVRNNSAEILVNNVLLDAAVDTRRGSADTRRYETRQNSAEILTRVDRPSEVLISSVADRRSSADTRRYEHRNNSAEIRVNNVATDKRGSSEMLANGTMTHNIPIEIRRGSAETRRYDARNNSAEILVNSAIDRRGSADVRRYDARKNSGEILSGSPRVEITFSPATTRKNYVVTSESSSATIQLATRPKMLVDDLGGGINYSKYMNEIKHRQYNEPKRNITDLYLKSPTATRKSGSTGDLFDQVSSNDKSSTIQSSSSKSSSKRTVNVQNLIDDELNFYETFSHPSTSYLNTDVHLANDKRSNRNSRHYDAADSDYPAHGHHQPAQDQSRIVVNFKSGGSTSNITTNDLGSQPRTTSIRTLSRDELTEQNSTSRGVRSYNYTNSNNGSRENLTAEHHHHHQQQQQTRQNLPRNLGKLLISYMQKNNQFIVSIHRAENLYKDKEDPLDTYVAMILIPDPTKQSTCITFVAENSVNPTWNEKFVYSVDLESVRTKWVYLSIKDHTMASELLSTGLQYEALKLISLGEALIPLSNIQENVLYEEWCYLKEPSEVQDVILSKDL